MDLLSLTSQTLLATGHSLQHQSNTPSSTPTTSSTTTTCYKVLSTTTHAATPIKYCYTKHIRPNQAAKRAQWLSFYLCQCFVTEIDLGSWSPIRSSRSVAVVSVVVSSSSTVLVLVLVLVLVSVLVLVLVLVVVVVVVLVVVVWEYQRFLLLL